MGQHRYREFSHCGESPTTKNSYRFLALRSRGRMRERARNGKVMSHSGKRCFQGTLPQVRRFEQVCLRIRPSNADAEANNETMCKEMVGKRA